MKKLNFEEEIEASNSFGIFLKEKIVDNSDFDLDVLDVHLQMAQELIKEQSERIKDLDAKRIHIGLLLIGFIPYFILKSEAIFKNDTSTIFFLIAISSVIALGGAVYFSFRNFGDIHHVGEGVLPSGFLTTKTVDFNLKQTKVLRLLNLEVRVNVNKRLISKKWLNLNYQQICFLVSIGFFSYLLFN